MKLFGFKKKKQIEEKETEKEQLNQLFEEQMQAFIQEEELGTEIEKKETTFQSKEDRIIFLKENCEQILEASRQIDEAKGEYKIVTDYLTDIQKIERADLEEKQILEDAARRIITLTRERSNYQKSEIKITDAQFANIQKYEGEVLTSMKQMCENEDYNKSVKNDIRCLQKEKKLLRKQKREIIEKQKYLKGISIIMCVLVVSLFSLFMMISYAFEKEMIVPYVMTIIMAAISAGYIVYESRKNHYEIVIAERKMSRAIGLLNKVKIKYVNTTNALDYAYEKFSVTSGAEFQYRWEQYLKAKEASKRYQKNTELLNKYSEVLIEVLEKLNVIDKEIWVYQAIAILDSKEMVEIRHRLNIRRQKLRERIDYNTKLKKMGIEEIEKLIQQKPEYRTEVIETLKMFHLDIS